MIEIIITPNTLITLIHSTQTASKDETLACLPTTTLKYVGKDRVPTSHEKRETRGPNSESEERIGRKVLSCEEQAYLGSGGCVCV